MSACAEYSGTSRLNGWLLLLTQYVTFVSSAMNAEKFVGAVCGPGAKLSWPSDCAGSGGAGGGGGA